MPEIRHRVSSVNQSIVVLDDDPTGTQTVYDTPVITDWSENSITTEFERKEPLFYILTNSRSVTAC
ncbi:MAG: four-carbon acid sugar kinase family protein, partial [Verrucomicrobiales bacterium]